MSIEKVFESLREQGFPVNAANALEVFGRKGDWHTKYYANLVSALEVWEINPDFLKDLKFNLPDAKIKITDSIEEMKTATSKYDLIVIDNPQSIYGDGKYCEHFELFPHVLRVLNNAGVIVLNVNVEPYDFHEGMEWYERRRNFYNTNFPEKLSLDYVAKHYEKLCVSNGCGMKWSFFVSRNSFISYFAFCISK